MYRPDVVSLKQFYASPLGSAVYTLLWKRLRALWPTARGETILGFGFAVPYLAEVSENISIICMPAAQGALYWPVNTAQCGGNRVAMSHEAMLPFSDATFNRILVIHALEHSHHAGDFMKELWRVMIPGGRVIALVPNRMGFWSHSTSSPFGEGSPFSLGQMKDAFESAGFTHMRTASSLFMLPSQWRWNVRLAGIMELFGQLLCPLLGGVLLVEAEKQVYAAMREPVRVAGMQKTSPAYSIVPSTMDGVSS